MIDKKAQICISRYFFASLSIVFVILLIVVCVYFINRGAVLQSMSSVCEEMGGYKATDFKPDVLRGYNLVFLIECDGEDIYIAELKKECSSYDKWGDCVKYKDLFSRRVTR